MLVASGKSTNPSVSSDICGVAGQEGSGVAGGEGGGDVVAAMLAVLIDHVVKMITLEACASLIIAKLMWLL